VSSDGGSFGCSSLRVGTDWHVRCSTYPDEAPIFSVDAGPMSASISPADRHQVSAEAVAFARELARQAARFAADCERLHAAQADQAHDTGPVAANDAA
jgi:hypothetical protein